MCKFAFNLTTALILVILLSSLTHAKYFRQETTIEHSDGGKTTVTTDNTGTHVEHADPQGNVYTTENNQESHKQNVDTHSKSQGDKVNKTNTSGSEK